MENLDEEEFANAGLQLVKNESELEALPLVKMKSDLREIGYQDYIE